jgi:small conductance mechanosensitive channel
MESFVAWVTSHAIALLAGLVLLVIVYRYAKPLIHRFVMVLLKAQQATLDGGGAPADEVRKRAATLEELLSKLIRLAVFALAIVLVLSVFDLGGMVAGLSLVAAAVTLAGHSIILDYLMGILILVEGQFFNGDWITVSDGNRVVDGEVQEVGLRRTVIRDVTGTVHSISNGVIRLSSNMTRIFGVATVELRILRAHDLDRALGIVERVGTEMAADSQWKDRLLERPQLSLITDLTVDGALLRVSFRTQPNDRWKAASEVRRRLTLALAAERIAIGRWDAVPEPSVDAVAAMPVRDGNGVPS